MDGSWQCFISELRDVFFVSLGVNVFVCLLL